jgi:tetratricopeptide (TPR) repeat protein
MTATALSSDRADGRKQIWWAAGLIALVLLAHGAALGGAFIWDDFSLITQNRLIRDFEGLWQFWFTTKPPDYFPLTSTTWWIEWRLWGMHPAGYHAVNLLLHAASAVLIWRILLELELPGAWLAAAIWAVHPVQVESVAWIAERKNTLSIALAAASLLLLLRYFKEKLATDGAQICTDKEKDESAFHLCSSVPHLWLKLFLPALLTFTAALLAKTAVAPLPIVMLICAKRYGRTWRQAVRETIPFFVITAALSAVTIFFQSQRSIATDVVRTDGLASRLAIAGRAVWFYLGKLLWPMPLSFVYPRWPTGDVSVRAFVPLLLLVLIFGLLWIGRRRWGQTPFLAMGYFVLMLLPVLGLINIYFMRYSLVADHWQYAASIGPIAIFAAIVTRARVQWVAGPIAVFCLCIVSERQAFLYSSGEALWADTVSKNPSSWMAQISLGQVLDSERRYADAESHYRAAAAIAPDLAEPRFSIGTAEAQEGRFAEAIADYQQTIKLNPRVAAAYTEMGHCLAQMNQLDRAEACFKKAIELEPGDADQRYQLGMLLEQMNRRDDAIKAYESAVAIDPDFAAAQFGLARCLLAENRSTEAAVHLHLAETAEKNPH